MVKDPHRQDKPYCSSSSVQRVSLAVLLGRDEGREALQSSRDLRGLRCFVPKCLCISVPKVTKHPTLHLRDARRAPYAVRRAEASLVHHEYLGRQRYSPVVLRAKETLLEPHTEPPAGLQTGDMVETRPRLPSQPLWRASAELTRLGRINKAQRSVF
eukprot:scaffold6866_cov134-Pinguiococcus_pyrenoidosus.AAC.1